MISPWDGLLSEMAFAIATLLPPLAPLHACFVNGGGVNGGVGGVNGGAARGCGFVKGAVPSAVAQWTLRLMLVRVVLGMGKFKFSRGWSHPANHAYLQGFLSWQVRSPTSSMISA